MKRYNPTTRNIGSFCLPEMEKNKNGDYVTYETATKLARACRYQRASTKMALWLIFEVEDQGWMNSEPQSIVRKKRREISNKAAQLYKEAMEE